MQGGDGIMFVRLSFLIELAFVIMVFQENESFSA